jgi:hypothetical protein
MEHFLIVLLAIALFVIYHTTKEDFMETSYYYEAAPGARGARMICMPENGGTASLGIAVGRAARDAAARIASRNLGTCGPIVNHATIDTVDIVDTQTRPKCPPGAVWDGQKCMYGLKTSPGCPQGMIWDGKKCRYPSAQTSPGCPYGMIWDGKKCRLPSRSSVTTSPGCPPGTVWDGKKCKIPSRTIVNTSPGCPLGMVWDGKKCKIPSRAAIRNPVYYRPGTTGSKKVSKCPKGTKWDGKKCKKVSNCPAGTKWDGKTKKCKKVSNCPKGTKWDGKTKKCKKVSNCPKGTKWDGKTKKCKKVSGGKKVSNCPKGTKWDGKTKKCKKVSKCAKGTKWNSKMKKCRPSKAAQTGKKFKKVNNKKLKKTPAAVKAALQDPSRKKKCGKGKFWDPKGKSCISKAWKCKIGKERWNGKKCVKI